jgi:hypothetical protein
LVGARAFGSVTFLVGVRMQIQADGIRFSIVFALRGIAQ